MDNKLISVSNLNRKNVDKIISKANYIKQNINEYPKKDLLKGKILGCVFYEPSTRTSASFQAAMYKLGGNVIMLNSSNSSNQKGEDLEDTIITMETYCDALVLRHPMKNSSLIASKICQKALFNAGDGNGEHPTQALLDLFTIQDEMGYIGYNVEQKRNMNIVFCGDLKNSRTVHSLIKLLCLYDKINLIYVSPEGLELPNEIIKYVTEYNSSKYNNKTKLNQIISNLKDAIKTADVLYVTRVQKERFDSVDSYNQVKDSYVINNKLMKQALKKMIIMHPLPRNNEITKEVDNDPRAAYFRQMKNGLYTRMALLLEYI
jgi:aspartate carbamoyltransferase